MWVKLKRTKSPIHHKQRWLRIKGIVKYPLQFKELQFLARDLLSKLYIYTHGSHYYDKRRRRVRKKGGGLEVVVLFFSFQYCKYQKEMLLLRKNTTFKLKIIINPSVNQFLCCCLEFFQPETTKKVFPLKLKLPNTKYMIDIFTVEEIDHLKLADELFREKQTNLKKNVSLHKNIE